MNQKIPAAVSGGQSAAGILLRFHLVSALHGNFIEELEHLVQLGVLLFLPGAVQHDLALV